MPVIFLLVWSTEKGNPSWLCQAEPLMVSYRHVAQVSCKEQESRELWGRIWSVTRCVFDIYRDFCDCSEGALLMQKQKCDGAYLYFPRNSQNSHYELLLCKRTNNPNYTLRHAGTHFRVRIKWQEILLKTRSWKVKCRSWTNPSNAKQSSQNNLCISPSAPENSPRISGTWEIQLVSVYNFFHCIPMYHNTY